LELIKQNKMLIVGLGNPGKEYAITRHNAGEMLLEYLRNDWGFPELKLDKYTEALTSKDDNTILSFPQTFMNESGKSVLSIMKKENISSEQLLVLHDDKDFSFGEIKLQKDISSAGHKGVQSIIDTIGTNSFWRLRIGIGPVPEFLLTEDFVLQNFLDTELKKMPEIFQASKQKIEHLLQENISK
jgi:PTH1 family peptidyl-tRNA hydrolase